MVYGLTPENILAEVVEVNYEPAMLVRVDGRLDSVYVCSIADEVVVGTASSATLTNSSTSRGS